MLKPGFYILLFAFLSSSLSHAQQAYYKLTLTDSTEYEGTVDSITAEFIYFKINNIESRKFNKSEVSSLWNNREAIPIGQDKPKIIKNTTVKKAVVYWSDLGLNSTLYNARAGVGFKIAHIRPVYPTVSIGFTGNNYLSSTRITHDPITFQLADVNASLMLPFTSKLTPAFVEISGGYGLNFTSKEGFEPGDLISKKGGHQIGLDVGLLIYSKRDKLNWKVSFFLTQKRMEFIYDGFTFGSFGSKTRVMEQYTMNRVGMRFGLIF